MTDQEIRDELMKQAGIAAQESCNSDACFDFAMDRLYDQGVKIADLAANPIYSWFLEYCGQLETKDHQYEEVDAEPPYDVCTSCGHVRR